MKIIFTLSLLCALFSCQSEIRRFPEPDDLVPRDTMVMILQDLTVLESHIINKYPQANVFQDLMKTSGDTLLAKYHMKYERFNQSVSYYGSRQDEMQSIYTEVQDSLSWKLNHLEAAGGAKAVTYK